MYVMHLKVIVFAGGLIVLQCLVRVQRHSQPLPTKLLNWSSGVLTVAHISAHMLTGILASTSHEPSLTGNKK